MAKGANVASGVNYYDGTGRADNTKGRAHPKIIGSGLETTSKISGSVVSIPSPPSGSATYPAGVSRGDGTARLRGTDYQTRRGNVGAGPGGSGPKNKRTPGAVSKGNGIAVKRSITDPK